MNPEDYADILEEYGNEWKMTPDLHSLNAV